MKGDFTKSTFRREKQYNSVRLQQGRVQLDADWNEQIDIQHHLTRTQSTDVIGASGAPRVGGGFAISPSNGDLEISAGRFYVDGLLTVNMPPCDGSSNPLPVLYGQQPFLPNPPAPLDPPVDGTLLYLVYLDVWERHITAVEDRQIREVALGGPDTATRMQTIWQVKLMQLQLGETANPPSCWDVPDEWNTLIHAQKGTLKARTDVEQSVDDPCIVPAAAGYRRLENQLYRVEIHEVTPAVTFKWSRDNGVVVTRLLGINESDNKILTVAETGKDAVHHFEPGQWVEISDDPRVLHNEAGVMVRLASVEGNNLKIEAWPGGAPPVLDLATATVRRWDHKGTGVQDLTQWGGALPLTQNNWLELEDGVQVWFDLAEGAAFHTGDYWLIPARVVGGDIEWPRDTGGEPLAQAPQGIDHHYCRLAMGRWNGAAFIPLSSGESELRDCRPLFPALTEPDIYYISGDGQEAMPGEVLPQPLRVGVVNCNRPIEGAWIKFEIIDGTGTLEPDTGIPGYTQLADNGSGGITAFILPTDGGGEVQTVWRLQTLPPETDDPGQLVKATLLKEPDPGLANDPANQLDVPVLFGASFGVAWQDRYGGARFPNPPFTKLLAPTVERALDQLRENVALYYVSGDGQEIPRARLPAEGDRPLTPLPQPLEVRVANGDWPYENAMVTFTVTTGDGGLAPDDETAATETELSVPTEPDGTARCYWSLDSLNWNQQVTARLEPVHPEYDDTGKPWPYVSDSVLIFNANLSVAERVTYDGSPFPDNQHTELRVETVEEALDQLRENVTLYYVSGDGQEAMPGERLPQALQVRVANNDWPYEGATVRFEVTEGSGLLYPAEAGATEITVVTNANGLAECFLLLDEVNHSQQVTATVESDEGHSFVSASPIRFNATTSIAKQVFYDSSATVARWEEINDPSEVGFSGEHLWSHNFQGTSTDVGYRVAVDAHNNTLLTGYFYGTINLGGEDLVSVGGTKDIFVAKFAPDGTHMWSHRFGSNLSADTASGIAVDLSGNVLLTGYFNQTINFGGDDLISAQQSIDLFVVKFTPDGEHIWSKRFGGISFDYASKITSDNSGNILLTGYFQGTINFGGNDLVSVDRDLFVVKLASDGSHLWSHHYGGTDLDTAYGIAADNSGNVLLTGYFRETIDFGGGELTTNDGNEDLFIVKFAPDGSHLWSTSFGGSLSNIGYAVAVDNSDNVLLTGYFTGTMDLGGEDVVTSTGNDVFVIKLDSTGALQWAKNFDNTGSDVGNDIAVDKHGNILLTGYFSGTINFGGGELSSVGGSNDLFVVKFATDGMHLWSKRYGGTGSDLAHSIAVDGNDDILLTGYFAGTVNFGGEDLTAIGTDLFILKLNGGGRIPLTVQDAIDNIVNNMESGDIGYVVPDCPPAPTGVPLFKELLDASGPTNLKTLWDKVLCDLDAARVPYVPNNRQARWEEIIDPGEPGFSGEHIWSRSFQGSSWDYGRAIAVDSNNNIVLVGYFAGVLDFGGSEPLEATMNDLFVAKFTSDGEHIWSHNYQGTDNDYAFGVAIDSNDDIVLTGYFSGTLDFGNNPMQASGTDLYVAKLSRDGGHIWSNNFVNTDSSAYSWGIAVDSNDDIVLTGYFTGTLDFGNHPMTSVGASDLFVAKLNPAGEHLWSNNFSGSITEYGWGIAVDRNNNIVLCGYFSGVLDFGNNPLEATGTDLYVAKLSSAGQHLWSHNYPGSGSDYAYAIAADSNNNILLTGTFTGTLDFGNNPMQASGTDLYVAKLSNAGEHLWSHNFTSTGSEYGRGIAVDSNNNVIVSGYFTGELDFGNHPMQSVGYDLFVATLNSSGEHMWSRNYQGTSTDLSYAVTADHSDNILVTGYFVGTINFGGADLTAVGTDMFILKLKGGRTLPVTVQAAIDSLLDNLDPGDLAIRSEQVAFDNITVRDALINLQVARDSFNPPGTIICFAGSKAPPDGWLECNGQALSRTDPAYVDLFAVIGTNYGAGNGDTTFNVPNLVGRVPIGSGQYQEPDGYTLTLGMGQNYGAARHRLVGSEMPSHSHTAYTNTWGGVDNASSQGWPYNEVHTSFRTTDRGRTNVLLAGAIANSGGNAPHNNLQPSLVLRYFIKS